MSLVETVDFYCFDDNYLDHTSTVLHPVKTIETVAGMKQLKAQELLTPYHGHRHEVVYLLDSTVKKKVERILMFRAICERYFSVDSTVDNFTKELALEFKINYYPAIQVTLKIRIEFIGVMHYLVRLRKCDR